jgi:hypothetical protein
MGRQGAMRLRFPAILACSVAGALWGTGCDPNPPSPFDAKPLLALQWVGGHLRMSVALCPGESVRDAAIEEDAPVGSIGHQWSVVAPTRDRTETITAFVVPTGWTLERGSYDELRSLDDDGLQELLPGVKYTASVFTTGSEGRQSRITFTLKSFQHLIAGQLLVGKGDDTSSKVEDRNTFRSEALSSC